MKKTLKIIALSLCAVMLTLCFLAILPAESRTAAAESTVIYEDEFDYDSFAGKTLFDNVVWQAEDPSSGNQAIPDFYAQTPVIEDGVMKLTEGASAQFNWTGLKNLNYSANRTLTLKFDVKITDFGDDKGIRDVWSRELYVAPGGWFNQIEMRNNNAAGRAVRAGDTWKGTTGSEYKTGVVYTIIIEWKPSENKIQSTIKNGSTTIASGARTNAAYNSSAKPMNNWVMRCEDGAVEIDNFSFSDGQNEYEQDFSHSVQPGTMVYNGYWAVESEQRGGATAPTIENGEVKFDSKDSVSFKWTKDLKHDPPLSYWFEFDAKITDLGKGYEWLNPASTRTIYVASGGYWNHIELPTSKNQVRAGDTYVDLDPSAYLSRTVKIKLVYEGASIYSYIYDASGKKLVSGVRSSSEFMDVNTKTMDDLVIRCEDGAFEMDNFRFGSERVECVASKELALSSGKTATYSSELNYVEGSKASLKLNATEIFAISDDGLSVCGPMVSGAYGEGKYGVDLFVNPDQYMLHVTVTLPDGGVLQRGTYAMLGGAEAFGVGLFVNGGATATEKSVSYGDVTLNDYEIITTRPEKTGFDANVYNLVTSFDDAATTRNFAFTAKSTYIGGGEMALSYKAEGGEWKTVTAVKENEAINYAEEYYKVELTSLSPDTEYEYKIGKKASNIASDWSKTYAFKTASGSEDEFTFLAVGDTQGITWEGTSVSNKGFMYAQAAYTEAMEENPDAAFLMHAGDVVESGGNADQWNMFFDSLGEIGATTPHFAAIGNHDTVSVGGEFYFDLHFNHPNNGGTAKLDTVYTGQITNGNLKAMASRADETFYSYDYGDAHFIVLNTGNYSGDDKMLIEAQRKWLEEDIKANACARWKVVLLHEPVYHRVGGAESRPWLYDVIESNGVDLVLQGHSHLVTRSYPMKDGKIATKSAGDEIAQGTGTVYTTIGSTALNHDSIGSPNMEEMYKILTPKNELSAYTAVKVSGDKLVMTVKQIDGFVLDAFEITASGSESGHKGEITLTGKKDATCVENGYTGDKICEACGKIVEKGTEIKAEGHVFDKTVVGDDYKKSDATCTSKATYYYSCKCGEKGEQFFESGEALGHSYDDGAVTKEPTEDEEGEKTFSCSTCGDKKTEKIDKLPSSGNQGGNDGGNAGDDGNQGGNAGNEDESKGCGAVTTGSGSDFTGGLMAMLTLFGLAALLTKKRARN